MKHELTAKRLQTAMSNINITAQELSNRSGVAKASISQYVNGSHKPSNISSGKMASILDVNPLWLMGFDVPMQNETLTNNDSATLKIIFNRFGYELQPFNIDGCFLLRHKKEKDFLVVLSEYELNTMLYDVSDYITNLISKRFVEMIDSVRNTNELNAAHTRTDIPITDADIAHDEDIMDDDKF